MGHRAEIKCYLMLSYKITVFCILPGNCWQYFWFNTNRSSYFIISKSHVVFFVIRVGINREIQDWFGICKIHHLKHNIVFDCCARRQILV